MRNGRVCKKPPELKSESNFGRAEHKKNSEGLRVQGFVKLELFRASSELHGGIAKTASFFTHTGHSD